LALEKEVPFILHCIITQFTGQGIWHLGSFTQVGKQPPQILQIRLHTLGGTLARQMLPKHLQT